MPLEAGTKSRKQGKWAEEQNFGSRVANELCTASLENMDESIAVRGEALESRNDSFAKLFRISLLQ
ncbi:hypothetical protein TorRG33x02_224060 [Trema orientale]|uniref:Uncharacterized protein n=1 Tax=Trema orientale TaxID=63057 RepID=A0A2P5E8C4_TREOI|nr:hypothetical protein TorRG33x02_224060 [Trema orientale]